MTIVPVILSEASGTRLWPMSRPEVLRQLLALTASRTHGGAFAASIVVANARHADHIDDQ